MSIFIAHWKLTNWNEDFNVAFPLILLFVGLIIILWPGFLRAQPPTVYTVTWTTRDHFEGTAVPDNSNYYITPTTRTDVLTNLSLNDIVLAKDRRWLQKTPTTIPAQRYYHALVEEGFSPGNIVMFGGLSTTYYSDTRLWNGTDWSANLSGATYPSARWAHAMAYDGTRIVLFGGITETDVYASDTWYWKSNGTWEGPKYPTTRPAARSGHTMVYIIGTNTCLLFGGKDATQYFNDLWKWDGSTETWTRLKDNGEPGNPPARRFHAAAWDGYRMIIFGGENASARKNDTYLWEDGSWLQVAGTVTPSARAAAGMTYDNSHQCVILFGGRTGGTADLSDTYEWNKLTKAWSNANPPGPTPSVRYGHALAYDSVRSVSLLFGGITPTTYDNQTWVYRDPNYYVASGEITGFKIDSQGLADWGQISWLVDLPSGTAVKFRTRGADTEAGLASATWSGAITVPGSAILTPNSRWLEISCTLTTNLSTNTPTLHEFSITYEKVGDYYESTGNGDWNTLATWKLLNGSTPMTPPGINDMVVITSTHQVSLTDSHSTCYNLYVQSGAALLFNGDSAETTLTLSDGGSISNAGAITITNDTYTCTLTSAGNATFSGNQIDFNGKRFSIGNLTFSSLLTISKNAMVTLVGNLSVNNGLTIAGDAGGIGKLIHSTAGNILKISGGNFQIDGRYEMGTPAGPTYLDFNYSVVGYGLRVSKTGSISATSSATTNRCFFRKIGSAVYDFYLYGEPGGDGPAVLLDGADISGIGRNTSPGYGIYVSAVDGTNDSGTSAITQGLTIQNCTINSAYDGIRLENSTGNNIITNTITAANYSINLTNARGITVTGNTLIFTGSAGGLYSYHATSGIDVQHIIRNNTIAKSGSVGGTGIYLNNCYTSITLTGNTITNCAKGLALYVTGTNPIRLENCSFGITNPNTADIYFENISASSAVELYNCLLASSHEVDTTYLNTVGKYVLSRKHDQTPGLWRVWGEWGGYAGNPPTIKIRSDTESYPGAGDGSVAQPVSKIVEFAATPFYTGYTGTAGSLLELVGSDEDHPVIWRSVDGITPYIIKVGQSTGASATFTAYCVWFYQVDASNGVFIGKNARIIPATGPGLPTNSGLDYCRFLDFKGSGQFLKLACSGDITTTGNWFDNSPTGRNIWIYNDTNLRLTGYTRLNLYLDWDDDTGPPGAPNDPKTAPSTITWKITTSDEPMWFYSVANGDWADTNTWQIDTDQNGTPDTPATRLPGAKDYVLITNSTVRVTASDYVCLALEVDRRGSLSIDLNTGGPATTFTLDSTAGQIWNWGVITFTDPAPQGKKVVFKRQDNEPGLLFVGSEPRWSDNLTLELINATVSMNFMTNNKTATLRLNGTCEIRGDVHLYSNNLQIKLEPGDTLLINGNLSVGGANPSESSTLELGPNTTLKFRCNIDGQSGLMVGAYGTFSATGTSPTQRDCIITSADTTKKGYLYLKPGSQSTFKNCEISYLGTNTPNKYGLSATGIDGSQTDQGLTLENCSIHHNYCISLSNVAYGNLIRNTIFSNTQDGLYLSTCSSNNIGSNIIYLNSFHGIRLENNSYGNILSNNDTYNNGSAGIYGGIYLKSSSSNTITNNSSYNLGTNYQDYGIYIYSNSTNNALNGNTCSSNYDGIHLDSSPNNILTGNICSSNSLNGTYLGASSNITIINENYYFNATTGVSGPGLVSVQGCVFGSISATGFTPAPNGYDLSSVGTLTLKCCRLDSPNPVAGSNILSLKHNHCSIGVMRRALPGIIHWDCPSVPESRDDCSPWISHLFSIFTHSSYLSGWDVKSNFKGFLFRDPTRQQQS